MVPAAARTKEPYTLAILWHDRCAPRFPALDFRIVATDADGEVLARAERGCYRPSSFGPCVHPVGRVFCVKPEYRRGVVFLLCRNVAFTYFDDAMQRVTLRRIEDRLHPGGALVIGSTEPLPAEASGFEPWWARLGVHPWEVPRPPAGVRPPHRGEAVSPSPVVSVASTRNARRWDWHVRCSTSRSSPSPR